MRAIQPPDLTSSQPFVLCGLEAGGFFTPSCADGAKSAENLICDVTATSCVVTFCSPNGNVRTNE